MREPELGIAVSPRDWSERLHRYVADHGGARVRTRIIRPEDVVLESFDVLVIDDLTSYLNRRLVQTAQQHGKTVLGVFDGSEFREGAQRLWTLGVDSVIDASASPEDFLREVGTIFRSVDDADHDSDSRTGTEDQGAPVGSILVVGGPTGGVGRTEVAVALCDEWRRRRLSPVLVDADELAPSIAQRLGLPLHPNLRSCVDEVQHRDGNVRDSLLVRKHIGFPILSGLANSRDWAEVRPGETTELIGELALEYNPVVVDIGSRIEDLTNLGSPDRFRLARAMLGASDLIVAVGAPTPIGLARLVDWLAEASTIVGSKPIYCVFNRASGSSFQKREVLIELGRSFDPVGISFLPEDPRVAAAGWSGELVDTGPFRRAVAEVAKSLATVQQRLVSA